MTEGIDWLDDDAAVERPDATGVARVDAVLDAVVQAGERPLAEQVSIFETAHAELRRSLDDPGPA
jgi:hypothetical protein